ncbi:uncharacterized protein LOC121956833 [Plectropomus leopardus]|uniref:uncharacterized protein LOC121956833 n=1 Tax=Plectropomus leopardus TaxID=160734 RepID=UPI001C4ADE93|nr:uncharacterized protein LOC121956833 [Plectropomus leopardus]
MPAVITRGQKLSTTPSPHLSSWIQFCLLLIAAVLVGITQVFFAAKRKLTGRLLERCRQQEEETQLTRDTEEEWWKTAKEKVHVKLRLKVMQTQARVALSDRLSADNDPSSRSDIPIAPPQLHPLIQTWEQTRSQKTPEDEDEDEEAADARKEEQEEKESVDCTARAHGHYQADEDKDVQVNKETEDHFSVQMAQRTFHESEQEGRSVLGMVAVQVERDPKTGASVIMSVAPVSEPAGAAPMSTTIFDDGRKSIHAVGGSGIQPSTEELGQILSIVDGVGMKVLLDEVTVTPNKVETKTEIVDEAQEGEVLSFPACHATSKEDKTQLEISGGYDSEVELETEGYALSLGNKENKNDSLAVEDAAGEVDIVEDLRFTKAFGNTKIKKEDSMVVGDVAGKVNIVEDLRLKTAFGNKEDKNEDSVAVGDVAGEVDNLVDLRFRKGLGITKYKKENCVVFGDVAGEVDNVDDLRPKKGLRNIEDKNEDSVAVGKVAGEVDNVEDLPLKEGPVTLVFLGYTDANQAQSQEDQEGSTIAVERVIITEDGEEHVIGPAPAPARAEKDAPALQDVHLDENGVKVQREEDDKKLDNSSPPAAADGGETTKRKSCQCCSVM